MKPAGLATARSRQTFTTQSATSGRCTPFRIDAANSNYVKLDNRIVTRLFGEIAPKRGDLVFSKTGDIIGIMVNSDYCAVLGNFAPAYALKTGDNPEPKTSVILADVYTRLQRLPIKLQ